MGWEEEIRKFAILKQREEREKIEREKEERKKARELSKKYNPLIKKVCRKFCGALGWVFRTEYENKETGSRFVIKKSTSPGELLIEVNPCKGTNQDCVPHYSVGIGKDRGFQNEIVISLSALTEEKLTKAIIECLK